MDNISLPNYSIQNRDPELLSTKFLSTKPAVRETGGWPQSTPLSSGGIASVSE